MTNIIKTALIIGSLLTPVAAFAGDAKTPAKGTGSGAGSGSATAPSTDKTTAPKGDVKKDAGKKTTPPAKDTTPPATK